MNVEIGNETAQFLNWEYLFQFWYSVWDKLYLLMFTAKFLSCPSSCSFDELLIPIGPLFQLQYNFLAL